MGIAFWPTLAGAVSASLVMGTLVRLTGKRLSPVGVSIAGALTHNLAQLGAIYPFFPGAGLGYYLPFLVLLAVPAGLFTGLVGGRILRALPREAAQPADSTKMQRDQAGTPGCSDEPGCSR